jgi:hypothetical protein
LKVTSLKVTSLKVTSLKVTSLKVTSLKVTSLKVTSLKVTSLKVTSTEYYKFLNCRFFKSKSLIGTIAREAGKINSSIFTFVPECP